MPCALVNNFEEVFEHPQIVARGVVQEIEHPRLGTMKVTRNPVLLDHDGPDIARPAPMLGEHSEEILRELGYDAGRDRQARVGGRDQARGARAAEGHGGGISSCLCPAASSTSRPTAKNSSTRRWGCRRTRFCSIWRIPCRRPEKDNARAGVKEYAPKFGGHRVWVRVNGLETGLAEADLDAVIGLKDFAGIFLPKVETPRGGAALGRRHRRAGESARHCARARRGSCCRSRARSACSTPMHVDRGAARRIAVVRRRAGRRSQHRSRLHLVERRAGDDDRARAWR